MNFEPQKFFIGLMDFFSILLPGALITYLVKDQAGPALFGHAGYGAIAGAEGWFVFLFSSYLLGHFAFLVGAWALDNWVYDPLRKRSPGKEIERLARGKELHLRLWRWLARHSIKGDSDRALRAAVRIKEHYLGPLAATHAVNAFQWSKARLAGESPEAMASVQRFEADSKFFRSLVVVLLFLPAWSLGLYLYLRLHPDAAANDVASPHWWHTGTVGWVLIVGAYLVLLLGALWRYVDQRSKSTSQAYWDILTLESRSKSGYRRPFGDGRGDPSRAGGVVYRVGSRRVEEDGQSKDEKVCEFLFVRPSRDWPAGPDGKETPWVLPKGKVKPPEELPETAVREVLEEAGWWARVREDLGVRSFSVDKGVDKEKKEKEVVYVKFYLMEALKTGKRQEKERGTKWMTLEEAKTSEEGIHEETRTLLEDVVANKVPGILSEATRRRDRAGRGHR